MVVVVVVGVEGKVRKWLRTANPNRNIVTPALVLGFSLNLSVYTSG